MVPCEQSIVKFAILSQSLWISVCNRYKINYSITSSEAQAYRGGTGTLLLIDFFCHL